MFKRSGAIVLTLLYLVTVSGFALNLHYCGKLLTAVKIDAPAKACNNGMPGQMKCCKNKQIIIKIKDAHQSEAGSFLNKIFGFEVAKFPLASISLHAPSIITEAAFDRGPPEPLLNNTPVFIKNCTFLI